MIKLILALPVFAFIPRMYCFDCHSPLRVDEIDGFRPDLPLTSDARINFRWIYTQRDGEEVVPLCEDCFAELVEESQPICYANCGKQLKALEDYLVYHGCTFCDEDCLNNFTGSFLEQEQELEQEQVEHHCQECGEVIEGISTDDDESHYCSRCQADIDTADSVVY